VFETKDLIMIFNFVIHSISNCHIYIWQKLLSFCIQEICLRNQSWESNLWLL